MYPFLFYRINYLIYEMSLANKILQESIDWDIEEKTKNFLLTWQTGSTRALNLLTPEVINVLEQTVDKESYTLYRGFWYSVDDKYRIKRELGANFENLNGGIRFRQFTPTSWTNDLTVAIKFADPFLNTLTGERATNDSFSDFETEDILAYSFIISNTFSSKEMMADLNNIPQKYLIKRNEKEAIVLPGAYRVSLVNKKSYTKEDVK